MPHRHICIKPGSDLIGFAGINAAVIRKGLPWPVASKVKECYDVSDESFARLLGTSSKTISRIRKKEAALSPEMSDRAYRLMKVLCLAARLFGDYDAAQKWLSRPQRGLNNNIPLTMLDTEPGFEAVQLLLHQLEYGVLP